MQKTYIQILYKDGTTCVCEPQEVTAMTSGHDGFATREVHMTEAEFEALPEFEG